MLRLGTFVLALLPFFARVQTVALPQHSGWVILHKGQEIQLGNRFLYISVFDQKGLATYVKTNSMGIINHSGKVVFDTPHKVTMLGFGNFLHNDNELLKIQSENILRHPFALDKNTSHWLIGHIKDSAIAFNKIENVKLDLGRTKFEVFDQHLTHSRNSTFCLYNSTGKLIDSTGIESTNDAETSQSYCSKKVIGDHKVLLWFTSRLKGIFHDRGFFLCPKALEFTALKNYVEIREAGQAHLYDLERQKVVMSVKGEYIRPVESEIFRYSVDGKFGLINVRGQKLIPPAYDDIQLFSQYTLVKKGNLFGLYNEKFKSILECKFSKILPRYNFYYTQRSSGRGLVSRKTNHEILEPVYSKILIQDNKIKAWLNNRLLIFVINDNHQIIQDYVVNNVISADNTNFTDADINYDSRLFQLGWFFKTDNIRDEKGNNRFVLRWGLKNDFDSIVQKPQYNSLRYIHKAPIVLLNKDISPKSFYSKEFCAVSNLTGKQIKGLSIVDIDTTDFYTRDFARILGPDGYCGIIKKDHNFQKFPYVDRGDDKYLRVCVTAKVSMEKPKKNMKDSTNLVPILNPNLNSPILYKTLKVKDEYFSHYRFEGAGWNFLNKDGSLLCKENFYFAHRFVGSNAIVLTKTGYGVIDSTGFIIEPKYKKISREFYKGDTLFLVETFALGNSLYEWQNGKLKRLPVSNVALQKNQKSISILASAYQRQVIHEEMGIIKDSLNHVKLFKNGYFTIKANKIYHIYNSKGNEIGQSKMKPSKILNDAYFSAVDKGKAGLYTMEGNSVSGLIYIDFELSGDFILANKGTTIDIFDGSGKMIYADCDWVLQDPITGQMAIRMKEKIHFSGSESTIKINGLVHQGPKLFFNSKLYLKSNHVFDANGADSRSDFGEFSSVEYLGSGFVALESLKLPLRVCNIDGSQIQLPHEKIRNPKLLSNQILRYEYNSEKFIFHIPTQKHLKVVEIYGEFNDSLLCVKLEENRYVYLNTSLENAFDHVFENAKQFRGGRAAVRYISGWTIIDNNGKCLYIPCLPEIFILSTELVLANPQSQLGLFDKKGKIVIPADKDNIHLAHDHIRTCAFGVIERW